jgi:hypothetical protein
MTVESISSLVVSLVTLAFVIVLMVRLRGRKRGVRSGPGPGAAGAVYGLLQEDKRRAIEIIAEGRAEATDPEHADGTPEAGGDGQKRAGR